MIRLVDIPLRGVEELGLVTNVSNSTELATREGHSVGEAPGNGVHRHNQRQIWLRFHLGPMSSLDSLSPCSPIPENKSVADSESVVVAGDSSAIASVTASQLSRGQVQGTRR